MTRKEFERIQKEHTKLELKILRLQAQQRMLLEPLIGQCVECPTGFEDFISGTATLGCGCTNSKLKGVIND